MPERRTIDELLAAARSRIDRLGPAATRQAMADGALVVDTRCAEQRRVTGVIPGAAHIPLSVLYWRLDPTSGYSDPRFDDIDRRIILVCADGYSSSIAAATLRDLGFARAGDLDGGFSAWSAAGLPVEALPDEPAAASTDR
jgi:rhodanese-related sulfurtransferase